MVWGKIPRLGKQWKAFKVNNRKFVKIQRDFGKRKSLRKKPTS